MAKRALTVLDQAESNDLAGVGVLVEGNKRSGTYLLRDDETFQVQVRDDGLELMPIAEALRRYPQVGESYYWGLIDADMDEVTASCAAEDTPQGYFVRVREGAKVQFPCQSGLLLSRDDGVQKVHNIIVLEPRSELHLITGCLTPSHTRTGRHLAVSEVRIGAEASLTNTMIHSWGPDVEVQPRAAIAVDDGGSYVSNYVSLHTAKRISTNPRTYLNGRDATARYYSIVVGGDGAMIRSGGEVHLNGENSRAELIHRAVCTGGAIYQGGLLYGNAPCRAHIDCSGLLLDAGDEGFIESQPGLHARHPDAQMSHEASIGKIAPEQVEYLQARGLDEQEAISLIIRGFLSTDIAGLGPELDARIGELAALAMTGEGG